MDQAKRNLRAIDKRLREIDLQIESLRIERAKLNAARGDPHLTFGAAGELASNLRNINKLQTLGRVQTLLIEFGHPLSTSALISLLKPHSPTGVSPVTLRSHLRRLRLEGKLQYDPAIRKWRPPVQQEVEKK